MITKVENAIIPFFPGFYNSTYEMDTESELESINQDNNITISYDDIDWDNGKWKEDISRNFCKYLSDYLPKKLQISFEYGSVESPKEYNFTTDKIVGNISYNHFELLKYLAANKESFIKYLKDNHQSRSGFISFMDHEYREFCSQIATDDRYLTSAINFVCENEDIPEEYLYSDVVENVNIVYSVKYEHLADSIEKELIEKKELQINRGKFLYSEEYLTDLRTKENMITCYTPKKQDFSESFFWTNGNNDFEPVYDLAEFLESEY